MPVARSRTKRFLPSGQQFTIEFERRADVPATPSPYIRISARSGIDATLRLVDAVQYRARVDNFDFDLTVERFSFSATPGDSLRTFSRRKQRRPKGTQNLAGIADLAVDTLVDIIIAAKTRDGAHHGLQGTRDRVIRSGRY